METYIAANDNENHSLLHYICGNMMPEKNIIFYDARCPYTGKWRGLECRSKCELIEWLENEFFDMCEDDDSVFQASEEVDVISYQIDDDGEMINVNKENFIYLRYER